MTNNEVAIVTGGSRGIGFAIALMLVEEGFHVVICSRSQKEGIGASKALKEIRLKCGGTGKIVYHIVDVGREDQACNFINKVVKEFGRIDILVNNAAEAVKKGFEKVKKSDIQTIFETNLYGLFWCTKNSLPFLLKSPRHLIVNLSSKMDTKPVEGCSIYSVTKGAISSFTRALAIEYPSSKLRVFGIKPGKVETKLLNKLRPGEKAKYKPKDVAEWVRYLIFDRTNDKSGAIYAMPGSIQNMCGKKNMRKKNAENRIYIKRKRI